MNGVSLLDVAIAAAVTVLAVWACIRVAVWLVDRRDGRLERLADPTRRTEAEIRRDWPPAPTDPPK